jgi:hypothetical protein
MIKGFVDKEDKDGLWNFFASLAEEDEVFVHDRHWLEILINWVPEGGVPLTESAKWFKLADRVGDLDIEKEGPFTLSPYQVDLIWQRLINPLFKMDRLPMPFVKFVQDFQQATGKHFPEEEPDAEDSTA